MAYVSFVVFAVIRVITAIFLKETLDAAENDADVAVSERRAKTAADLDKLRRIFIHSDKNGDGMVTFAEFESVMSQTDVQHYLSSLDLEIDEYKMLFTLLDDGDGIITYDEFIDGLSRLKGQARTLDMVALQLDLKKVLKIMNQKFASSGASLRNTHTVEKAAVKHAIAQSSLPE